MTTNNRIGQAVGGSYPHKGDIHTNRSFLRLHWIWKNLREPWGQKCSATKKNEYSSTFVEENLRNSHHPYARVSKLDVSAPVEERLNGWHVPGLCRFYRPVLFAHEACFAVVLIGSAGQGTNTARVRHSTKHTSQSQGRGGREEGKEAGKMIKQADNAAKPVEHGLLKACTIPPTARPKPNAPRRMGGVNPRSTKNATASGLILWSLCRRDRLLELPLL